MCFCAFSFNNVEAVRMATYFTLYTKTLLIWQIFFKGILAPRNFGKELP